MSDGKKDFLPYKIICGPGMGEIVEKKSRFIANVAPADSEETAVSFIESIRKKYYDARHNCPAFVIGRNRELTRCSDDGEPSGTAGKPILEVINGAGLTNTVIVVTRYFGGTLLGTGGLVRAYTEAAKAGLENAGIATMRYGASISIQTDYTDLGKIQYLLGNKGIPILDSLYTDRVELMVRVPEETTDFLMKELTESTGARAVLTILEKSYYMDKES
ncbi:MAG: YigZ family protein [Suilimivivens sp.]